MPLNSTGQVNTAINQAFPPQQGNALRRIAQTALRADLRTQESDTTTNLAAVSELALEGLEAGKRYAVHAVLHVTGAGAGGNKIDFNGGSVTASSVTGNVKLFTASAVAVVALTALNTAAGATAANLIVEADLTIVVSVGGRLVLQHAQNAASGSSTVNVGSYIEGVELPA